MIPWNFFNSVVTQSGTSFINNEGLIKKIYLPKAIFPMSIAFALMIDSALSFLALFALLIALGDPLSWSVLFLLRRFCFYFLRVGRRANHGGCDGYFRDLQHVILIVMQGLFFLTPILYNYEALTGKGLDCRVEPSRAVYRNISCPYTNSYAEWKRDIAGGRDFGSCNGYWLVGFFSPREKAHF